VIAMKAKYTATKCMISIIAALILAATAAKGAGAQQVETIRTVVVPPVGLETMPELGIVTATDLAGMVQVGVYDEICEPTYAGGLIWKFEENTDEPPEIRIMSRIIRTALSGVEAPELPEQVTEKGEATGFAYFTLGEKYRGVFNLVPGLPGPISVYSGSRKVSGFYMNGYGYLFTIRWPIRSSSLISSFYRGGSENLVLQLQAQNEILEQLLIERSDRSRRSGVAAGAGRADEERKAEEEYEDQEERRREREELARQIEEWKTEFENRLIDAMKDVMATYGHTLHRAAPEESITFIFEQSDEDEDNITLTVKRAELGGPAEKELALRAIRVSRGSAETNPALKSQIRIMAEIIDAAFEYEEEEQHIYVVAGGAYFGGAARTQYIPGYGVIFRKNARISPISFIGELATLPEPPEPDEVAAEARVSARARRLTAAIEGATEESREKIQEHLENLKKKTAAILATYGTTLTELKDEEWIGINYEVGSAASLLQSGVSNFLVLARMSRVREAARQGGNSAEWLLEHLVTNKKPEF